MFTGLIQEVGRLRAIRSAGGGAHLQIEAPLIGPVAEIGESIAVNGTCLTVETSGAWGFTCHAGAETLQRTTVGGLSTGARLDLERALSAGDRLGGHFVQGHVDCVGELVRRSDEGSSVRFEFEIPQQYARYVVEKGSVAVDGISLTVASSTGSTFEVASIPHTLANTTLADAARGRRVNIEVDILAKYVERLVGPSGGDGVSRDTLAEHGFI